MRSRRPSRPDCTLNLTRRRVRTHIRVRAVSRRSTGYRRGKVVRLESLAEFRRNLSAQLVVLEVQLSVRLERLPSSGRYPCRLKMVFGEPQIYQAGEVAEFSRYSAAQLVRAEPQLCPGWTQTTALRAVSSRSTGYRRLRRAASIRVRRNAKPISERLVAQPVRVVRPVVAVGGVVEGDEG